MGNEDLKILITELLPAATYDESGEWLNIVVEPASWPAFAAQLRNHESLQFDYLFCLTCIDWKTNLSMVYHLSSTRYRHNIVVKSTLSADQPQINTVCDIWKTAELLEREVYEMFGVNLLNHPDLRLLILPDGWEGKNPMRKNYEDPINMIKL